MDEKKNKVNLYHLGYKTCVQELVNVLNEIQPCSDGGCIFKFRRTGGLSTNGGCRCRRENEIYLLKCVMLVKDFVRSADVRTKLIEDTENDEEE